MARNKLGLASERRKLQLRAIILNGRTQVANTQERIKRAREELKQYSSSRKAGDSATLSQLRNLGSRRVG